MSTSYSYKTLPNGNIRLLELLDIGTRSLQQPLRCRVRTQDLSRNPRFLAISYTWGDLPATQKINLDGHTLSIRPNLWACLSNLRRVIQRSGQPTLIWVDAICINQSDESERNAQVRLMARIFGDAESVVAWLGIPSSPLWFVWREEGAQSVEIDPWDPEDHILDVAQREYWSRMWIVQEMLLAKNIYCLVGDRMFDMQPLSHATQHVASRYPRELKQVLAHINARRLQIFSISRPLYDLLLEFGGFACRDPRDKVFALLSLIPEDERTFLGHIFPDYSLTHDAVVVITLSFFNDISRKAITASQDPIFDALAVKPSNRHRKTLLAVAKSLYFPQDLDSFKTRIISETPFSVSFGSDQEYNEDRFGDSISDEAATSHSSTCINVCCIV